MLWPEFVMTLIFCISYAIMAPHTFRKLVAAPIVEMRLLGVTAVVILLFALSSCLGTIFITPTEITFASLVFLRFAWSLLGWFFMLLSLSFFLPDFKGTYSDIGQLIIIVLFNAMISITTFAGVTFEVTTKHLIRIVFSPTLFALFMVSVVITLVYFARRMMIARRLQKEDPYLPWRTLVLIFACAIAAVVLVLLTFKLGDYTIFSAAPLPGYSFMIPYAGALVLSAHLVSANRSYPFIIPIKLYGIVFIQNETGMTLMSDDSDTGVSTVDLLGNLFAALNLTLQEAINSKGDMTDIVFGDKVVNLSSNGYCTVAMIVSKPSLLCKSLVSFLARQFDKQYHDIINPNNLEPINIRAFDTFLPVIEEVERYLIH